jgi:hypothetical protein
MQEEAIIKRQIKKLQRQKADINAETDFLNATEKETKYL